MELNYEIIAGDFSHAGFASSETKKVLKQLNISPKVIKRVVTALFEAEVNVSAHSYGGKVTCDISSQGISIIVADTGPGIPDLNLAMSEGYSTASREIQEMGFGAGMGLPNIKNNTDSLSIDTRAGGNTVISMWIDFKNSAN